MPNRRNGRLKLRQIDNLRSELVWYARADEEGPKASDYAVVPISNPETLKMALTAALRVRVIVNKRREIYLVDNVRIHLDEVAGLGTFLEFEAVLGPRVKDAAGHTQLAGLQEQFGITSVDLLPGSYSDMIS